MTDFYETGDRPSRMPPHPVAPHIGVETFVERPDDSATDAPKLTATQTGDLSSPDDRKPPDDGTTPSYPRPNRDGGNEDEAPLHSPAVSEPTTEKPDAADASGPPAIPPGTGDRPTPGGENEPKKPDGLVLFEMKAEAARPTQQDVEAAKRMLKQLNEFAMTAGAPFAHSNSAMISITDVAEGITRDLVAEHYTKAQAVTIFMKRSTELCPELIEYAESAENREVLRSDSGELMPGEPFPVGPFNVEVSQGRVILTDPPEEEKADIPAEVARMQRYDEPNGDIQVVQPDGSARIQIQQPADGGPLLTYEEFNSLPPGTTEYLKTLNEHLTRHGQLAEAISNGDRSIALREQLATSIAGIVDLIHADSGILGRHQDADSGRGFATLLDSMHGYAEAVLIAHQLEADSQHDQPAEVSPPPIIEEFDRIAGEQPDPIQRQAAIEARQSLSELVNEALVPFKHIAFMELESSPATRAAVAAEIVDRQLNDMLPALDTLRRGLSLSENVFFYVAAMGPTPFIASETQTWQPEEGPYPIGQFRVHSGTNGLEIEELSDWNYPLPLARYDDPSGNEAQFVMPGNYRIRVQRTGEGLQITRDDLVKLPPNSMVCLRYLTDLLERQQTMLVRAAANRDNQELRGQLIENTIRLAVLVNGDPDSYRTLPDMILLNEVTPGIADHMETFIATGTPPATTE